MKKITAVLMIIITLYSCFYCGILCLASNGTGMNNTSPLNTEKPEENPDSVTETAKDFFDFASLLTELVNETWEDSYFGEIVVHQNNTVSVDGSKTDKSLGDILSKETTNELITDKDLSSSNGNSPSYSVLQKAGYKVTTENNEVHISNPYQTKRLIVRTKNGALNKNFGAYRILSDGQGKYILQFKTENETKTAYEYLCKLDSIKTVSVDSVITVSATNPLTQSGRNRWGAERIESDRYKKYLADKKKTDKIVVAVVDTGAEMNHPFLKGRLLSNGYDFIKNDKIPDDENMHGTHCSGIIADNTPSTVKILPVKAFNSGGSSTDSIIAMGIDYAAEKGADVISMSFTGECNDDYCEIAIAVKNAVNSGSVCIAAAGNSFEDAENSCPARLDECITVASLDNMDRLSDFSNYGKAIDISAPGEDIWSTTLIKDGSYETASGTSMAAPFVSAAAAMLLTYNPKLTVSQVKTQLKNTTVDLGIKGEDNTFGAGALDFGVLFSGKTSATSISVKEKTITLYRSDNIAFETVPVTVTVSPMLAQNKSYTVKIKDSSVAAFDGFGFKAKKLGETTATFTLANGKSASVKIKCVKRQFWIDYAAKSFAGGEGTRNNPYLIKTAEQLARLSLLGKNNKLKTDAWFKQAADIDLKGKTWYPICARDANGLITRVNYDGSGYDIKNLQISNIKSGAYLYYSGLFAMNTGELKNINIIDADINCPDSNDAGAVCAYFGGVMKNCYVSGKINGGLAGGLVGSMSGININSSHMGIYNCRSDATVTATDHAGGISGTVTDGHIENCIFTGKLSAPSFGGITSIVYISGGNKDEYIYSDCKIINCVSTENIANFIYADTSSAEKIVPYLYNCYYSGEYDNGITGKAEDGVIIKSIKKVDATKLKTPSFYTEKGRWNSSCPWKIGSTWKVSKDYPHLSDQTYKTVFSQFDYYEVNGTVIVNGYYGKNPHMKVPATINGYPVTAIGSMFISHNVDVKKITLPDTVKIISGCAFEYDLGRIHKSLKSIDLGNGVEVVDARAFRDCNSLNTIVFPKSLKFLGYGAFVFSGLSYAFFEGDAIKINPSAFSVCDAKIYCKNGTKGWDTVRKKGLAIKFYDPAVPLVAIAESDNVHLRYGDKVSLGFTILPESASKAKITYHVSNSDFRIDSNGYVTTTATWVDDGIVSVKYNGKTIGSTIVNTVNSSYNYTVNFNGNTATSGSMKPQSIPYQIPTALYANNFRKTGYRFFGWTNKAGSKTILATDKEKVTALTGKGKSITLYAVWYPADYIVKFNANGGSGKMPSQILTYNKAARLSKNTFTAPEGKVFAGWSTTAKGNVKYTNTQAVKNLSDTHKATVNLYAVWVKKGTYKITYKTDGGKMPSKYSSTFKSGTGTTLPTPTKKGYDFSGWYRDSKKTRRVVKIPTYFTGNITLYASWKAHKYSVSFHSNGGTGKMSTQTGFYYGTYKSLAKCTFTAPKGKVFAGWASSKTGSPLYTNGQKVRNLTDKDGKTVILYAIWVTPKNYAIKYYTNGGTLDKSAKTLYKSGTGYTLPKATKKGYTFLGWYTDSNLKTGKITVIKPWHTGGIKLYAKWKKA